MEKCPYVRRGLAHLQQFKVDFGIADAPELQSVRYDNKLTVFLRPGCSVKEFCAKYVKFKVFPAWLAAVRVARQPTSFTLH